MGRMMRVVLHVMMLLCAGMVTAFAAEPPTEPILRINPDVQTAMITRIATDAAGRFLVTDSLDKRLRVWELPVGRLIRTIPPSRAGKGEEWKFQSVALSSDGKTIAASGWTKLGSDSNHPIYLFDRATGKMTRRITGLPNVIQHLAFSPDGKWLAASLGGSNGIRVYRTSNFSLAAKDNEYDSDSYSVHFSHEGRLVTTSLDGFVRLYEAGQSGWGQSSGEVATLSPRYKVKAPDGEQPFAARFSPDGTKIAVGYSDTAKVTIFSGKELSDPFTLPDTPNNGNMGRIAWSLDGKFLYTGGQYQKNQTCTIRRWSNEGRGTFIDIPAARNTITDFAPLPDGNVVFCSADPAFGMLSSTGERTLFAPLANADFRNNPDGFLLSPDGRKLRFGFKSFGRSCLFDLATRQLTLKRSPDSLTAPITTLPGQGVEVTEWKNTFTPKLNGTPLKLDDYEMSRSFALAPDGESFVLGTEWCLRCFDKQGKKLWSTSVPGVAWSVNIPTNGKVVVAALGDGTIRWYRLKDGKELQAFFPHADRKRWVLWTPDGHYDASVGGEDLIGWQVNRGKDKAADFYPASRFREKYYSPDIVGKALYDEKLMQAISKQFVSVINFLFIKPFLDPLIGLRVGDPAIKKILPPKIEIIESADGDISASSTTVKLRYQVRTHDNEPVTQVYANVNAQPVTTVTPKGGVGKPGEGEITVPIPDEDCEISLIAENRHSKSVPATIKVLWKGKAPAQKPLPRLLILAFGINNYDDPSLKALHYAAKDAADFVDALEKQKGVVYSDIITKPLCSNGRVSLLDIKNGLEWLHQEATERDIVVVFISGHGSNGGNMNGVYHLVPSEGLLTKLISTSLEFSSLNTAFGFIQRKLALVFLDSCHSGGANLNGNINKLNEKGVVVFASSTGSQTSSERDDWQNGAFTKALVEGLNGAADLMQDGKITITRLDAYISNRVDKLTGGQQEPVVNKTGIPDFLIARKMIGRHSENSKPEKR